MKGFLDMHRLSEDQQIDMICHRAVDHKEKVGFVIDDLQPKIDRYKKKILEKFPELRIVYEAHGPSPGVYTIIVDLKTKYN